MDSYVAMGLIVLVIGSLVGFPAAILEARGKSRRKRALAAGTGFVSAPVPGGQATTTAPGPAIWVHSETAPSTGANRG